MCIGQAAQPRPRRCASAGSRSRLTIGSPRRGRHTSGFIVPRTPTLRAPARGHGTRREYLQGTVGPRWVDSPPTSTRSDRGGERSRADGRVGEERRSETIGRTLRIPHLGGRFRRRCTLMDGIMKKTGSVANTSIPVATDVAVSTFGMTDASALRAWPRRRRRRVGLAARACARGGRPSDAGSVPSSVSHRRERLGNPSPCPLSSRSSWRVYCSSIWADLLVDLLHGLSEMGGVVGAAEEDSPLPCRSWAQESDHASYHAAPSRSRLEVVRGGGHGS